LRLVAKDFGEVTMCPACQKPLRVSRHPRIPCPRCGASLPLLPDHIGRKVRCTQCDHPFSSAGPPVPDSGTIPIIPPLPAAAPPAADSLPQRVQALAAEIRRVREELVQAQAARADEEVRRKQEVEQTQLRGDAERKELEEQWRRAHKVQLRAVEERLEEERKRWHAERDALRDEKERRDRAHAEELQAARLRADELKRQREAALEEIRALQRDLEKQPQSLDAERQALRERWDREHQEELRGLEERLRDAQAALRNPQSAAAKPPPDFTAERRALRDQLEQARRQVEELRTERDEVKHRLQALPPMSQVAAHDTLALQVQLQREGEADVRAAEQKGREQLETVRQQFAQERRGLLAESEHLRQEVTALRQWREATVRQLEALWQERDQAAASVERLAALERQLDGLRRERDEAVERLRSAPRPAPAPAGGRGGVVAACIIMAIVGFAVGVVVMLARQS
jgi:hypothetical protein